MMVLYVHTHTQRPHILYLSGHTLAGTILQKEPYHLQVILLSGHVQRSEAILQKPHQNKNIYKEQHAKNISQQAIIFSQCEIIHFCLTKVTKHKMCLCC